MSKVRMGIIGCGGISGGHIRGIMDSPDMEIGALCDIVPERLEDKRLMCGASQDICYDNHIALMESGNVDAVSICTPNNAHFHIAMDAVERGIPFAVEKPMCFDTGEAEKLAAAALDKKLPNMVCFSYRFKAAARFMRDLITSGELGRIYHVKGEYYQAWGLPNARNGQTAPLVWRFVKEITGSGALGDLGCHMLDLCRFITGREFTSLAADMDTFITKRKLLGSDGEGTVDVDDYINIAARMQDSVAANVAITRYAYGRGNYQWVEVYGENGALRYTLEDEDKIEINIGNSPMRAGRVWADVKPPQRYRVSQMQCFADIVNGKGDGLAADVSDGLAVQRVLDGAIMAAEKGVRIEL